MFKKYLAWCAGLSLVFSTVAFALDDVVVPNDQFLFALWQFVGGVKGLAGMALIAAVVQIVMMFFKTSLASFAGKYRLLIVLGLTVVASMVGLMSQGVSFTAALVNGATLSAIQVFAHQVYKQFIEKSAETA